MNENETVKALERITKDIAKELDEAAANNFMIKNEDSEDEDYFDDILDVNYLINSDMSYKAVKICVGWGGPNIYIDTESDRVVGYWGFKTAYYPLSYDTVCAIDAYWEERYLCFR